MIQYTQKQIEQKVEIAKSNVREACERFVAVSFGEWEILFNPADCLVPKLRLHYICHYLNEQENCTYDMYLT